MTDPNSTIPDHATPEFWRRYESWRVRRYEKACIKHAGRWPRLRNRRAYRRLVVLLAVAQAVVGASAVVAFFAAPWFFIPFLIGFGASLWVLLILRAVTGSVADAPIGALDDMQLAQRNSARSIGFIVIYSLAFIPYFVLIFMGSAMDHVSGQNVYGIGVLLIAVLYVGACTPTMLTAWWMSDPDPEDFDDVAHDDPIEADQKHVVATADHSVSEPAVDRSTDEAGPPTPAPW